MSVPTAARRYLANLWQTAAVFFAASDEVKLACQTDIGEGYRPYAWEYTDAPQHVDLVESFAVSVALSGTGTRFGNEPASSVSRALLEFHVALSALAEHVFRRVFQLLGHSVPSQPVGFRDWSRMQVNYGEPRRASRDLIHVAHEDGNFLSVIAATAPGLEQLQGRDGIRDLWGNDRELVLIAGEIFAWVTAGRVATGVHRVRRDTSYAERYSAIFFGDPNPASAVRWAPTIQPGELFHRITHGWVRSGIPPVQTTWKPLQEVTI